MGSLTKDQIQEEALKRKNRILEYMTQDPPVPLNSICEMEGMTQRSVRIIVKELETDNNLQYINVGSKPLPDGVPYGLTAATQRLRQKLADNLYLLRERGNDSSHFGRNQVSPRVGINTREQCKAESRPFAHDWKLSQVERLARELGRDPVEFMLSCLTT